MPEYTWGSNSVKANTGDFLPTWSFTSSTPSNADIMRAASRFVHYLHGTNPLSLVYLTNMDAYGAENSANEMFHTWFADGSAKWDQVGRLHLRPAAGYLAGGPNPSYDWDGCCPSGCGSTANNAICSAESISPPKGQPAQKVL